MMAISRAVFTLHLYVLYLSFTLCENVNESDESTIKFAIIAFRHGERSPSVLYPKDPYQNYTWIGGLGTLTKRGMQQVYNLGVKYRQRFKLLLPSDSNLSLNEIYFLRSSAKKRCQESALSFLSGFLSSPHDSQHLLNSSQRTIHVTAKEKDKLISQRAPCPRYDKMLKKLFTNPPDDLKRFIDSNTELFKYISKHTGKKVASIYSGEQLFDILSIEKAHGLDLPKWTEKVYPEKLLALAERTMAIFTENDFMKRVKGGYFITNVVDKMTQKSKNKLKPDRRLFIYSGHDTTLINVMRALNITSQTTNKPDFASSLSFELHQNRSIKNDLEVKIYYRSNLESNLKLIEIPNCKSPCSLAAFTKSVDHIIIRDYDQECNI